MGESNLWPSAVADKFGFSRRRNLPIADPFFFRGGHFLLGIGRPFDLLSRRCGWAFDYDFRFFFWLMCFQLASSFKSMCFRLVSSFKSKPFTALIVPIAEGFGLSSSDLRSFRRLTRVTRAKTFRILSSAVAESFKLSTFDSGFLRRPIVEFSHLAHHCRWIDVMAFRHCGRFLILTVWLRTTPPSDMLCRTCVFLYIYERVTGFVYHLIIVD